MFGRLGFWELVLILLIAMIIFGPRKLPEMGKALGKTLMEFRRAAKEFTDDLADGKDAAAPPNPSPDRDQKG